MQNTNFSHDCIASNCKENIFRCYGCKQYKPFIEFYLKPRLKTGHRPACKNCEKTRAVKYEQNLKDGNMLHDCTEANCHQKFRFCTSCLIEHPMTFYPISKTKLSAHGSTCRVKTYKNNAKNRNYTWGLTDEEALSLFNQPCYYCSYIKYFSGIDRVDNNIGYEVFNSVPCCSECNHAKFDIHGIEWLKYLLRFTNDADGKRERFQGWLEYLENKDKWRENFEEPEPGKYRGLGITRLPFEFWDEF